MNHEFAIPFYSTVKKNSQLEKKIKKKMENNQEKTIRFDLHTHILPKTWDNLKEKFGYGGFVSLHHHCERKAKMMKDDVFFREIDDNCWDPEVRIKDCDNDKIDVQVLRQINFFSIKSEYISKISKKSIQYQFYPFHQT